MPSESTSPASAAHRSRWLRILYWRHRGFVLGGVGAFVSGQVWGAGGILSFMLGLLACGVIIYWPRPS